MARTPRGTISQADVPTSSGPATGEPDAPGPDTAAPDTPGPDTAAPDTAAPDKAPASDTGQVPLTRAAVVRRTLRIAILGSRGIPAHYGGFETFAEQLSTRMARHGHRITVFCERTNGPRVSEHDDVRLQRVHTLPLGPLRTVLYDVASLARALRGFDAIYMLGYGAAWAFPIARAAGVPLVVNMDGVEWRRSKWSRPARAYLRWMEAWAVRTATAVVADSGQIRRHLEQRHGPLPHCHMIPYGASPLPAPPARELVDRLGLVPGEYDLVVCRLEPENHVQEIVRGHTASRTPRRLVVVGPLADTRHVRRLRREADRAARGVRWLGGVYDPALLSALRFHARVSIHGHSVGGTNPSLLEALAAGSGVIAHDNEYNREVLGPSADYFRNEASLRDVLMRLDRDPDSILPTATRARAIIEERYRWSAIVNEYEALFDRVAPA